MKIIRVKVKPNCSKTEIVKKENGLYRLNVKGKAEKGDANQEVIKFFSRYFKKNVKIIKGLRSREKLLKIE